jgi:ElaB/YqjD/DUF883 family membrane-anchored ribosome-binding protein
MTTPQPSGNPARDPAKETMMQHDGKTIQTTASTSFDALVAQMATLRDDMTRLTGSVSSLVERRGRRMASDISDGVSEAVQYVERKGKGAEADLEKSVAMHPLMALGLAAGIGLLIGAMTRRG